MTKEILKRLDKHDRAFAEIRDDLVEMKDEIHRLGLHSEENDKKVGIILEIVQSTHERMLPRDEVERDLTNHEIRISALESVVKAKI